MLDKVDALIVKRKGYPGLARKNEMFHPEKITYYKTIAFRTGIKPLDYNGFRPVAGTTSEHDFATFLTVQPQNVEALSIVPFGDFNLVFSHFSNLKELKIEGRLSQT